VKEHFITFFLFYSSPHCFISAEKYDFTKKVPRYTPVLHDICPNSIAHPLHRLHLEQISCKAGRISWNKSPSSQDAHILEHTIFRHTLISRKKDIAAGGVDADMAQNPEPKNGTAAE
jgi:hypothetical protein